MQKNKSRPSVGVPAISLIVCLLAVGVASAQSASGLFPVSGTVHDPAGAVVAGASVELRKGDVTLQTVTTDGSGAFHFSKVPAGVFEILVRAEGFATATMNLGVGRQAPAPVKVVMQVAGFRQETTVMADSGKISADTAENQNSVTMTGDALDNLPVFDQDYVGTMSRFLDSSDLGTNGVSLVVDGVEVNDLGLSPSAIKEIKINNDPYAAEFMRPGRGRIEITTKPGSQEYHGSFNFIFRDNVFNGREPFALMRPSEQRRIYEGYFTGPLFNSRNTSFLISVDRNEEDVASIVNAIGPKGLVQENIPSPTRNLLAAAKISHRFSDNNDMSVRYSYQERSGRNQGVGGITLPEAGTKTEFREDEIQYNQSTIFSTKLVNQFRLLVGRYSSPTVSLNHDPRIVVQDAFVAGGAQADQLRTEYHFALTEILSYSSGRNTIKGGINIPDWSRRGFDNEVNFGGTFSFSSLQDYLARRPYSFVQQQGNGHLIFIEKVVGEFVQDDLRLRSNLMFSFGLRYDWQNYFHDNNNFAPRFSFAYSPSKKTVIRGGAGMFYDRTGPRPIQDLLQLNGQRLRMYVLSNPGFPDPFVADGQLSTQPVSVVRLDPKVQIPYTIQYSAGVERQFLKAATISVTYLGSRGVDRFRSRDINAPAPPGYLARLDSSFGVIRQIESSGRSASDSLEVSFRGRVSRYFTGMAQYRLARSHDNTNGINYFPANNYDLSGEWARSDYDRRHKFEFLGTFSAGKLFNLGASLSVNTGAPYTEITGHDDFNDGFATARPPGVPRNSLQGPGYADVDFRISRDFSVMKSRKEKSPTLTVGLDAFNALNRVNFAGFVGNLSSPFFGQAVAANPPRRLQFSVRIKF